jgi:hypothetical protein
MALLQTPITMEIVLKNIVVVFLLIVSMAVTTESEAQSNLSDIPFYVPGTCARRPLTDTDWAALAKTDAKLGPEKFQQMAEPDRNRVCVTRAQLDQVRRTGSFDPTWGKGFVVRYLTGEELALVKVAFERWLASL